MNKTNLEYIEIFGLFGKYDVKIPFDKQVNIFVGENGLGKTTILDCIYCLLEKDFSRLADMPFSRVEIKFKNESEVWRIDAGVHKQGNDDAISRNVTHRIIYLPAHRRAEDLVSEFTVKHNNRVEEFVATCNRYLNDKEFVYNQVTSTLDLFLKRGEGTRKIQVAQLSSGEKQIVSLFSKLYLESDRKSIVIIDEPELSLSLMWQKMLLPDVVRSGNCDLLVTATHSPFIFDNEFDDDVKELRQYMTRGENNGESI